MSCKVIITETAKQDLREIAFYQAERSKDKQLAREFVSGLRDECKKLQVFPEVGALSRDRILRSAGQRFLVYKDYLIFYVVDTEGKSVHVLAFFDAKKDHMRVSVD